MACKIEEIIKDIESLANKAGLKGKKAELEAIVADMRAFSIPAVLTETKVQANPEHQNYMINWLKSTTNATVDKTSELLRLTGLLENKLAMVAGSYAKATNHIQVLDNVKRADVEAKIRTELYINYLKTQGKTVEEFNAEVITALDTAEVNTAVSKMATDILETVQKSDGSQILLHELVHANTQVFMEQNPKHAATKRVQELYKIALDNKEQIDKAIGDGIVKDYWATNVDEFIAEGLSNPDVMAALMNVSVEGKERLSVFKELIKAVTDMLGLDAAGKDNVYNLLLDSMSVMITEQGGVDVMNRMETEAVESKLKAGLGNDVTSVKAQMRDEEVELKREAAKAKVIQDSKLDKMSPVNKKAYAKLLNTPTNANPAYVNSMVNFLKAVSPAVIKEVNSIFNNRLEMMAGSYDHVRNEIKLLKNPRPSDVATGIKNSMKEAVRRAHNIEFLTDEMYDKLNSKDAFKVYEIMAGDVIKELEGLKGKQVMLHELVHANTQKFMLDNKDHVATKRVNELYKMATANRDAIDTMMRDSGGVDPYWSMNVDEFVAEGLRNPKFMAALMNTPVKGMEQLSVFGELIKAITHMLGVKGTAKSNMYTLLLDSTMAMVQTQTDTKVFDTAADILKLSTKAETKQTSGKMTANKIIEEALECAKG